MIETEIVTIVSENLSYRLLQQVLGRFEEEGGGHLLVVTLCLLEVSATGLLEAELLQLLADEEILMPNSIEEKGSLFIKSNRKISFKLYIVFLHIGVISRIEMH